MSKREIEDDFDDKDLTPQERRRLRRLLQEDAFARHFKTTVKVWLITLGTVASAITALKLLLWDAVKRMLLS